ncbi:heat-inducible transcriptional repressor HrcA [Corynebacterium choanae]|uniref:Heat-inducible transcription repressor HrcA n=1 Tax=Corynebacterium choanae TaxID=1862358 RepID=A0A3G6J7U9_9CORY|nr:heat-inducible transcriptional repressor HrcA [Corynebacterium choanae]AZA14066.1 Heat-inducible transcription repressor HrcA [Corynebacterium choanae]
MTSATDRRRVEVLRAIVADYIASQEPVGSKRLVQRHGLDVSPATIRNDMAHLEREGYIVQQHTSSGRIPTEKGYRLFVDTLTEVKPLSGPERRAIVTFLEGGVDTEDVLRRSVQLLSQLTRQAAVVQLPQLTISTVLHLEVVPLATTRWLLVVILNTGRVEQRYVDFAHPVAESDVERVKTVLSQALVGNTVAKAAQDVKTLRDAPPPGLAHPVAACVTTLLETLVEAPREKLLLAGTANLSANFPTGLTDVLDALEEQVVVLRLMATAQETGAVQVSIGGETQAEPLRRAAVVTAGYGQDDTPLGAMAVVGPTFMDYPATMAKLAAVARYVSRILGTD